MIKCDFCGKYNTLFAPVYSKEVLVGSACPKCFRKLDHERLARGGISRLEHAFAELNVRNGVAEK